MDSILPSAIQIAQQFEIIYTKFVSANDVGKTSHEKSRSHQAGFYIGKSFLNHVFEEIIQKDKDYELFVTINWQNQFQTQSRFKYYGSKNECHLTRLGKDFPFRSDKNVGDLLILCKASKEYYYGFVLQSDEEIEDFFAALNISATVTNDVIQKHEVSANGNLLQCFANYIKTLTADFPSTEDLAFHARQCYGNTFSVTEKKIRKNPDKHIVGWLDTEFRLFKKLEDDRYSESIKSTFKSVEDLIETANTILNRRKSRAGKSLEHHLAAIFRNFSVQFSPQATTEGNRKPDFLFPSKEAYHNPKFDQSKLILLASKTTCKDRWRQVLSEAKKITKKHLFTLQQGISKNQLEEMYDENVQLVVPSAYIKTFPEKFQSKILSLHEFVQLVIKNQS